jgi:hypothetical protein
MCPSGGSSPTCPCTSPAPVAAAKAKLTIRGINLVGNSRISLKGVLTGLPATPPLDPVTNGLRLLIEGANDTGSILDVSIPAGAFSTGTGTGWHENTSATNFGYVNPAGVQGIEKVKLRLAQGIVKFTVLGKGGTFNGGYSLDPSQLPLSALIVLDTPDGSNGQCGIASFPGPAPSPACTATPAIIRCK